MYTFREKLAQNGRFLLGVELVSTRGSMQDRQAIETRTFATELVHCNDIDWVSITDNAGGNPQLSPMALGKPILYAGKEVLIHLSCKDFNRNGLESAAWELASEGFHNILALSGDYPGGGYNGQGKPVFDIDSIGLTNMINKLNHGLDLGNNSIGEPTAFCVGVGVNPGAINIDEEIKRFEWKVEAGAQYAITQPVFDTDQLRQFLKRIEHVRIPIIAGIWPLVSYRNAEFLHNEVPGVRVTPSIMERMRVASAISKEAGRDEGLKIARESLLEVRDVIQGVQVSAPFGNVKYALEVFEALSVP